MPKSAPGPATVRVFPMPVAPLYGVAHKVQDVTPEEAARLTDPATVSPTALDPAFVSDAALLPEGYRPPDPDGLLPQPTAATTATPSED